MVDRPPWLAMELLGARPTTTPAAEGVLRWEGEVEGTSARPAGEEVWRRGRQIRSAMKRTTSSILVTGDNVMGATMRRAFGKNGHGVNSEALSAFYRVGNG
jgi:hypothetical protein